ncbi:hypothetical protein Lalb_Chr21g0304831 [Lupinus albus]|uniref:Uncharacterized protein n=1 Tax=Lupinus albus TaxID=3870 RepID=A0A6A4NR30_LUPAL|nr:hypothetical protein Lalb_Chr21g0304831 [Lupinus albus]
MNPSNTYLCFSLIYICLIMKQFLIISLFILSYWFAGFFVSGIPVLIIFLYPY